MLLGGLTLVDFRIMVAPRETFSGQNPWGSQAEPPLNTPRMGRDPHNRHAQEPFRNDFREFQRVELEALLLLSG